MSVLFWIILSTVGLSALAFIGILTLLLKDSLLKKIIFPLVAFSAGALLGNAFFDLIPEGLLGMAKSETTLLWVVIGFGSFFLLEQFIHWHHCHELPCEHNLSIRYLILVSDGIHNFIDGLAVGTAFIIDINLGLATTLAVAAHEIPQELGDFGILIHSGWSKAKALIFNFASGLTMVAGGLLAWLVARELNIAFLLPFAAGNFIYIAASDLIPQIKGHTDPKKNFGYFLSFALGLVLIWLVGNLE